MFTRSRSRSSSKFIVVGLRVVYSKTGTPYLKFCSEKKCRFSAKFRDYGHEMLCNDLSVTTSFCNSFGNQVPAL